VQESARQTNKIGVYSQTVDLDVAGSNPVTHPMRLKDLHQIAPVDFLPGLRGGYLSDHTCFRRGQRFAAPDRIHEVDIRTWDKVV